MIQKSEIVAELGEQAVLLPTLVQQGLCANERAKYYFSLLQTAQQKAEHPERTIPDLRVERKAAGIADARFDEVMPGAVRVGDGRYRIPHLGEILGGIREAIDEMFEPLVASGAPGAGALGARRTALAGSLRLRTADEIDRQGIGALTLGGRSSADSLHLLVMDLHRCLNALLERLAEETIDGAQAFMLGAGDREFVTAFMRGLNRTAPLRFDHPGLGTTATRARARLVIQNDIGMTKAHVLVITVEERTVTVTYTDVHLPRVAFFQSLFDGWEVTWTETLSQKGHETVESGEYHLLVGTYSAPDRARCAAFLEHLGSRLVFLIDWNKARKRLRLFLSNRDATGVLREAADADIGHRGFLEIGGDRLVSSALDLASPMPRLQGQFLHLLLGREKAMEFFSRAFQTATEGLLKGEPHELLRDRCRAELFRDIHPARARILERCLVHAALVLDLGRELSIIVGSLRAGTVQDYPDMETDRLRVIEADLLASDVRILAYGAGEEWLFSDLVRAQDEALGALIEGCQYAPLIETVRFSPAILTALDSMVDLATSAQSEYASALSTALALEATQETARLKEFVRATRRVIEIGPENETARWRAERTLVTGLDDAGAIHAGTALVSSVAASTRALARAAGLLRDVTLPGIRP